MGEFFIVAGLKFRLASPKFNKGGLPQHAIKISPSGRYFYCGMLDLNLRPILIDRNTFGCYS